MMANDTSSNSRHRHMAGPRTFAPFTACMYFAWETHAVCCLLFTCTLLLLLLLHTVMSIAVQSTLYFAVLALCTVSVNA